MDFADIARRHLLIETLETRSSDSLDFHEVSVWGVKAALEEAYAGPKAKPDPWRTIEIVRIAREVLNIPTLKTQSSDSLDFHEVSVWGVEKALKVTYAVGVDDANIPNIRYKVLPDGNLRFIANTAARAELRERLDNTELGYPAAQSYLIEQVTGNGLDFLRPEYIGALTEAPVFGTDVDYAEDGTVSAVKALYWFPNYAVADEMSELADTGMVVFAKSPDILAAPYLPEVASSFDTAAFVAALSSAKQAAEALRVAMREAVAGELVATATLFAPSEADFNEALHADGPDGNHALIAVEDRLAGFIARRPLAIDVMRDSPEWDDKTREYDANRAALAVVNEALSHAEALWAARPTSPAPRR